MAAPSGNIPEFTVSELSKALKKTLEESFSFVRVRGEISGLSRPSSGHVYFSLKDEKAVLDAACWREIAAKLPFKPEDGLEVVVEGKISTYAPRSRYQIIVMKLEPAGAGALMALLEERKKKLAAEGLFEESRKKPLPYIPSVIGVVTSPTGAVIRDILHRLAERFPRHVLVWPVQVQGEAAAAQVAAAIEGFNAIKPGGKIPRPDLLIVARGGGSLEDLWGFNEEIVVRAAAASEIPLISAVGHETDITLIDYAADKRAPTPTAAAEIAVPVRSELQLKTRDFAQRLDRARLRYFDALKDRIAGLARGIPLPREILGLASQRLDDLAARLPRGLTSLVQNLRLALERSGRGLTLTSIRQGMQIRKGEFVDLSRRLSPAYRAMVETRAARLDSLTRLLANLSYQAVLKRGFAVVSAAGGGIVTSAKAVRPGQGLDIEFRDGHLPAVAGKGGSPKKSGKPRPKTAKKPKDQGSLF